MGSAGDVTEDRLVRLDYYKRAFELAGRNSEPTQTALLAIGELCMELEDWASAEAFLIAAREEAIACGDDETEGAARQRMRARRLAQKARHSL